MKVLLCDLKNYDKTQILWWCKDAITYISDFKFREIKSIKIVTKLWINHMDQYIYMYIYIVFQGNWLLTAFNFLHSFTHFNMLEWGN